MNKYIIPFKEGNSYTTFCVKVKADDVDDAVSKAWAYLRELKHDKDNIIEVGNLAIIFDHQTLEVLGGLIQEYI